jgi:hypothetical protein
MAEYMTIDWETTTVYGLSLPRFRDNLGALGDPRCLYGSDSSPSGLTSGRSIIYE